MTTTERGAMQVYAAPRLAGKTTRMIQWVLDGKLLPGWPGWSRILIVNSPQVAEWAIARFGHQDQALRNEFPPGLAGVIVTADQWRNARGRHRPGLEIAVDDADDLIARYLNAQPAVISVTGEFFRE